MPWRIVVKDLRIEVGPRALVVIAVVAIVVALLLAGARPADLVAAARHFAS